MSYGRRNAEVTPTAGRVNLRGLECNSFGSGEQFTGAENVAPCHKSFISHLTCNEKGQKRDLSG